MLNARAKYAKYFNDFNDAETQVMGTKHALHNSRAKMF